MKKNERLVIQKDHDAQINQHWHFLEYLGLDDQFLSFNYHKSSGDCKVLIPLDKVKHDDPITIMKQQFHVEKFSPDEVTLKYIGRTPNKR